jgi:hypothetical protein
MGIKEGRWREGGGAGEGRKGGGKREEIRKGGGGDGETEVEEDGRMKGTTKEGRKAGAKERNKEGS